MGAVSLNNANDENLTYRAVYHFSMLFEFRNNVLITIELLIPG